MKIIPLTEAKTHLRQYGVMCQKEPVIVTVDGVACFRLAPLEEEDDDDLINELLEHNPEFVQMLKERANGRTISLEEVIERL